MRDGSGGQIAVAKVRGCIGHYGAQPGGADASPPGNRQAVSRGAGEAYRARLLPLPAFLISDAQPDREDVLDALRLSGYFWEQRVFRPHDRKLPAARTRFVDRLGRQAAVSRS